MEDTLTMDRRQFLGGTAGVGLTLGFSLGGSLAPLASQAAGTPQPVNSWLTVGTDNSISLTVGASDMGQGSLQGLAQVIAEDLMVDFNRVTLVQGQATVGHEFGLVKFLANLVSYVAGIPGGLFSPALAVGAGLGHNLSLLLPAAPASALVLLGMCGYLAGVTQAPLTAANPATFYTPGAEGYTDYPVWHP